MAQTDNSIVIPITRLHENAVIPSYAHLTDAGADLVSVEDITLTPGERALVATGLALAIPDGFVGLVHPRSGLAIKNGVALVNAPGTIDAGYRGEVKVCLINLDSQTPVQLPAGSRIAQLVIQRVEHAKFQEVAQLADSDRGTGGFGSTGINS
ncbi:MAG: dUTP diphosphatase [Actinobacteria bacterium]|nr:dUTP diphosphatase [Actinomycetota bacterium]NBY15052.1 dUTP diphosphatase [Actinomycetota bacterium]